MAEETCLDLNNRDPHDINSGILKVLFEDVLAEPEGVHSADCVWNWSFKCYNGGKKCCYLFLTYLCALPTALCWGCCFGCVAFKYIWEYMPCMRMYAIQMGCMQKCYTTCIQCYLNPVCEAYALMFSKIAVKQSSA